MNRNLLIAGAIVLAAWLLWPAPETLRIDAGDLAASPAGFDVALSLDSPPVQRALEGSANAAVAGDFRITPAASFQVEARVLGRRNYRRGIEAQLSPLDLALGWGPMADPEALRDIRIRQSNRYYYWSVDSFPIPRREIERNSANMHMIPAGEAVARDLARVRPGQTVRLRGYLVNVERADGWRWRTSLRRDDTGSGACEIVLVERIEIM